MTSRSTSRPFGRELHWLLDQGADGVVMAMVSETLRLASDERDAVCDFVCQTIGARGATVISVGAESSFVAERHARHAERCGATMLMAIPPVAVALDEEAIADYYRRLISRGDDSRDRTGRQWLRGAADEHRTAGPPDGRV